MTAAVVALGAVGAWARAELAWALARRTGSTRGATWAANLLGAAALGFLAGLTLPATVDRAVLASLGTGFLGGFTTFSTWMVDSLADGRDGTAGPRPRAVVWNVAGMFAAGVAATALGLWLGELA